MKRLRLPEGVSKVCLGKIFKVELVRRLCSTDLATDNLMRGRGEKRREEKRREEKRREEKRREEKRRETSRASNAGKQRTTLPPTHGKLELQTLLNFLPEVVRAAGISASVMGAGDNGSALLT